MPVSKPVLYVLTISHYCEKALWALDYLGIDYAIRHLTPGEHRKTARKLGAPRGSVPYLYTDGQVIQGSANIIDWADGAAARGKNELTPAAAADECRQIESRIDDIAGVHVRRFYYSEALVDYPETVRPVFTSELPLHKRLLVTLAWGKIRKLMIAGMDLGEPQGRESRDILQRELDWLDGLLSDGRQYLVGERFSRADMAVASLLSPLVLPPEHPVYRNMRHPPQMHKVVSAWWQRPALTWVRNTYAQHRQGVAHDQGHETR